MITYRSLTIPQGQKLSAVVPTFLAEGNGYQAACLIVPVAMTSSEMYFNGAMTQAGTLYRVKKPMVSEDAAVPGGVGWYPLDLEIFATVPFLQIEAAVNELALRTLFLGFRAL